MAALFLLAVVVQLNDTEATRWMLVYGAAGALTVLELFGRLRRRWPMGLGLIALLWAVTILPRLQPSAVPQAFEAWQMRNTAVEELREAAGLVVVAAWMFVLARFGGHHPRERYSRP